MARMNRNPGPSAWSSTDSTSEFSFSESDSDSIVIVNRNNWSIGLFFYKNLIEQYEETLDAEKALIEEIIEAYDGNLTLPEYEVGFPPIFARINEMNSCNFLVDLNWRKRNGENTNKEIRENYWKVKMKGNVAGCVNFYFKKDDIVIMFGVKKNKAKRRIIINPILNQNMIYCIAIRQLSGYLGVFNYAYHSDKLPVNLYIRENGEISTCILATPVKKTIASNEEYLPLGYQKRNPRTFLRTTTGLEPEDSDKNISSTSSTLSRSLSLSPKVQQQHQNVALSDNDTDEFRNELEIARRIIYRESVEEDENVNDQNIALEDVAQELVDHGQFVGGRHRPRPRRIQGKDYIYEKLKDLEQQLKTLIIKKAKEGEAATMILEETKCFFGLVEGTVLPKYTLINTRTVRIKDETQKSVLVRLCTSEQEKRLGPIILSGQVIRVHRATVQMEHDLQLNHQVLCLSSAPHRNYVVFEMDPKTKEIKYNSAAVTPTITDADFVRVKELFALKERDLAMGVHNYTD